MPSALALPVAPLAVAAELEQLVDDANKLAEERHASATRRAYLSDFAAFEAWCAARAISAMPAAPAAVVLYLTALQKEQRACATIQRAIAGISHAHRARGFDSPTSESAVRKIMAGIRRTLGTAPTHHKNPVVDSELRALLASTTDDLVGLRDRAVLTLGWRGAFRRAELVSLNVEDVTRARLGLLVLLRNSKGDQEGAGAHVGIVDAKDPELCARRALETWLHRAKITRGPIFRGFFKGGRVRESALCDRAVALIVQRAAERAGLDPNKLAGHSLRSGFATTASLEGKSVTAIGRHLRQKSEKTTRRYLRPHTVFDDNATAGVA